MHILGNTPEASFANIGRWGKNKKKEKDAKGKITIIGKYDDSQILLFCTNLGWRCQNRVGEPGWGERDGIFLGKYQHKYSGTGENIILGSGGGEKSFELFQANFLSRKGEQCYGS